MDLKIYLNTFQNAASRLDQKALKKMQIEVAVGEMLGCVFLKLYKRSWTNQNEDPLFSKSRIFFSVWVDGSILTEQKLHYNIHAFKLRQLKGYSIESRKFADLFRVNFKKFEQQWKNVSVKFGPLTLMEGWLKIDPKDFQDEILELANNFLEIEPLVEHTLAQFKK